MVYAKAVDVQNNHDSGDNGIGGQETFEYNVNRRIRCYIYKHSSEQQHSNYGSILSGPLSFISDPSLKASRLSIFHKHKPVLHFNYKASCLDDFPRCHKPQETLWGMQDNEQRIPCSPISLEEEVV